MVTLRGLVASPLPDHDLLGSALHPIARIVVVLLASLVLLAAAVARAFAGPPTAAQELARPAAAPSAPAAGPLPARGPLVWTAPMGIDSGPINGLACPTISLCVAVDNAGQVLSSTDPLAGARTWHSADVDGVNPLTAVSCPSAAMCVAVDGQGNAAATSAPSGPASAWTVAPVDTSITEPSPYGGGPNLLRGISCPSVSLCLAVDSVGNVAYSGAPTGGAAAWALMHIDNGSDYACAAGGPTCQAPLMGVACPASALCGAVDFAGNLLQTTTPTVPSAWPSQAATGGGPQSLWSLSCPTTSFCATVDGTGGHAITWNPAAGSRLTTHRLPIDAFGVWCSSTTLCLAAGEGANGTAELAGSTNPASPSPAWAVTDFGLVNAVSCPTPSVCLAADNQGGVILGVTVTSLVATLQHEAIGGQIPRAGVLARRRGYPLQFTSPIAGQLTIAWAGSTTVLATASAHFNGPQKQTVSLNLTGPGRRVFKAGGRIRVSATATYQTNTGTVSAQRKLTLRPR
ncbi:MAG: hypothetical protein M3065_20710 [Actinomycetota bacterium]|nr:hypothetical protein [Actinomycetota bacterium]